MSTSEKVVVEVVIAARAEEVWRALREPAEIRRWFGWEYADIAEEITYIFEKAPVVEEGRRLDFPGPGEPFIFTLEPRGEQTVLRVVRAAPAGADWDGIYDEIVEGWRTFVQQLRFVLDHHRGETRRTLYLSGHSREGGPRPPAALGLSPLLSAQPGERYAVQIGPGDALTGDVLFRSAHQIGLAIDGLGHGMLVVHNRPPTPTSPHGGGMAVLTTYGLDDETFEALSARWTRWWNGEFDRPEVQPTAHPH
jgi:hypothetical protein